MFSCNIFTTKLQYHNSFHHYDDVNNSYDIEVRCQLELKTLEIMTRYNYLIFSAFCQHSDIRL